MPRYTVTPLAGPKVAGRRVEHGDILDLTENAARAEILAGTLLPAIEEEPAPVDAPEPEPTADGKKRR